MIRSCSISIFFSRAKLSSLTILLGSRLTEKILASSLGGIFVGYQEDFGIVPLEILAAGKPLRHFMFGQTRETDIMTFSQIAGHKKYSTHAEVPFSILVPAFVTSELKTAFQIGFLLYLSSILDTSFQSL